MCRPERRRRSRRIPRVSGAGFGAGATCRVGHRGLFARDRGHAKLLVQAIQPGLGFESSAFSTLDIMSVVRCTSMIGSCTAGQSRIGPPVPRAVLVALDPVCLREQYEDRRRSFSDISAELDIPPSDVVRHARKLGLAIRHGVSAHKHPRQPWRPRRLLRHPLGGLRQPRSRTTRPTAPGDPRTPRP